jgi:hypothetical protein
MESESRVPDSIYQPTTTINAMDRCSSHQYTTDESEK